MSDLGLQSAVKRVFTTTPRRRTRNRLRPRSGAAMRNLFRGRRDRLELHRLPWNSTWYAVVKLHILSTTPK